MTTPVRAAAAARSSAARGFTLMEMMVVVIIVAILAGLAIPSMLRARDDRRAYNNAMSVAQLLRGARLRAIGRGAAVAVSMSSSGTSDRGTYRVYEGVTVNPTGAPGPNNRTPLASCITTTWTDVSLGGQGLLIDGLNQNGPLEGTVDFETTISLNWVDRVGATTAGVVPAAWVCFTPAGRTYVASGATPTFVPGNTFVDLDICMSRGGPCSSSTVGLKRHVLVPPAGGARLYSK